jgi:intracellular sulfur oxidation DsrE/DsrF family protein
MKKFSYILGLCLLLAGSLSSFAQTAPSVFTGAQANLKSYKALYVLNSGDEKHITGTLRNIKNVLEDPRLKGKLEVELIAFGDGVSVFQKTGTFEQTLRDLQAKGVILAQCENTMRERKIEKDSLFDFISYVPSGNGEIVIRHYQGWAVVHP